MADKILKIKLEVDTGQAAKLVKITDDLATQTTTQVAKSKELLAIEAKVAEARNTAVSSLSKVIIQAEQYNNLLKQGGTAAYLANTQARAGLDSYNSKLLETQNNLKKVIAQQGSLASSFAFASGQSSAPSSRFQPSASDTAAQGVRSRNPITGSFTDEYQTKALEKYELRIKDLQESELRRAKQVADQKVFYAEAERNSKIHLYTDLFNQIEEKEKANLLKINSLKESLNRSANAVLEQQTKDRLARELEATRLAEQKRINSQAFAQRLNSVPRVTSQDSQIDITGTLSRYLKDQANATNAVNEAHKRLNNTLQQADEKHRSLIARIIEGVSIYRVYNTVLNTTLNALKAIPEIGIQLEATKSILTATVGSEASVNSVLSELNKEAERTGISVAVLRESFRTFNASALLAGESTETAYRIFTNLNTTITSLHLSADLAQHTFLAFSQILNKGKVQSEELVKQLGNLLPGAFATMAKSLDISTQELSKRMKQGLVTAHDSLDAFAKEYAKQFAQSFIIAQQGLNANIGRLQTSFTLLGESIYSQTNGAMVGFVKGMTSISNEFRAVIEGTSKWNSELNFLKTTIEVIAFTAISSSISNLGIKFIALTGNTVAMTAVVTKLKSAFSFLSVPTAIVAGILLIANQLKEAIVPAETLIDKLRASRKEAEDLVKQNAQIANLSEAGKITFDVENSEEVKKKFKDIKTLAEELEATKERLSNSKFNPFASINDIQKDKEFIKQGTEELKLQLKEFEKLKEEKKLQLNIDAIAAKKKETDFPAAAAAREAEQTEKDLAKIKEINFGKETAYNDKLRKDLEEEYKAQLNILQFKQKSLELEAKDQSVRGNQVPIRELPDRLNALQQQELDLKVQYQKKFEAIAIDSQDKIHKSVTNNNRISLEQALAAIQKIESAGDPGAVSNKLALGLRQVQPSTLVQPGFGVKGLPREGVLAQLVEIEKQVRGLDSKLQRDKSLPTREPTSKEIELAKNYALANTKTLAQVGIDYYTALDKRYGGDKVRAAAAYNAGPGNEDKGIRPKETKNYVSQFIKDTGGDNFDSALLAKQTEQQAAIDEQRSAAQGKYLLQQQRQLEIDTLIKTIKEEELTLGIQEAALKGNSLEEAQLKINDEFERKRLDYISKGAEAFIPRLENIKKEQLAEAKIAAIKEKYQQNEEKYVASIEDITRKTQISYLNTQQAIKETVNVQQEHLSIQGDLLKQWEKEAALSANVKDNIEAANAARERQRQLVESASFLTQPIGALTQAEQQKDSILVQTTGSQNDAETLQNDLLAKGLITEQQYQDSLDKIKTNAEQKRINATLDYYSTLSGAAADSFSSITSIMVQAYGAQSKQAKIAFAAQKAFQAGQAIISTYKAASDALAIGNPFIGIPLAAVITAAGLANVASILSQPVPAAHGGLENVPKEQTYLLDKGERVLSPRQNVDITNKVTNIHDKVSGQAPANNIRIVNVMDENLVYNALGSDQAEKVIMNIVNRNR